MSVPPFSSDAAARPPARVVMKDEPGTLVERLGSGDATVVRKTYRNRGLRLLQTFLRQSRAHREHGNLLAVARTGVPCTTALAATEQRWCGLVRSSTLDTAFVPGCRSLKDVLRDLAPSTAFRARRRLVVAMGELLARLHRGGVLWQTPMPRNVLVQGEPGDGRLLVCDVPMAIVGRTDLHGGRLAAIDLFDAAFSPSRRQELSASERRRLLGAYAGSDAALLRRLWHRLSRRRRILHRLHRSLAMAWCTYLS